MKFKEKQELLKVLFNLAYETIENRKYEENMSHNTFVEEMKRINDFFKENCLTNSIPCIKKEKRKEILENYRSILLQFVELTFKLGENLLQKEDIEKLSLEESESLLEELLKNL